VTVHRLAHSSGFVLIELADLAAERPTQDVTDGKVDPFRQPEVDLAGYLEWVGADALIELLQARIDEEDDSEGRNDVGAKATATTCNQRSRLLH
jgi:hypothetical protein